jgi:hypothetical protein
MNRPCVYDRLSSTLCGLALAVVGIGLAGCQDDAAAGAAPQAAVQPLGAECVELRGIRHCPLGAARLIPHGDGAVLEVTGNASAERDGISVVLPEVTSYTPTGRINGRAEGSALFARAMSGGKTIGTMSLARTPEGYRVAAAFTGDDSAGTYNVNLYYRDELVGQLANRPSGGAGDVLPYYRWWWWWWWDWYWPSFWSTARSATPGTCVWAQQLAPGDEVLVTDDTGRTVLADRFELEEVVQRGGSYPYLSFDRIDYTTGGAMLLEGENLENTH